MLHSKEKFGAIDVGSNSIHMLAVRWREDGQWEIIGRHKESVRLAEGLEENEHNLTEQAQERAIGALGRCLDWAKSMDCPVRAVATSAVRDARNQTTFLNRVEEATGLRIEVVSGHEEAHLIYLGLRSDPLLSEGALLGADVGGGSAEFTLGAGRELDFAASLPLGSVRLADRFFPNGEASSKAIKSCRQWVEGRLDPVIRGLRGRSWDRVVVTSGTAGTLASMIETRRTGFVPSRLDGVEFTLDELNFTVEEILAQERPKLRRKLLGIDEKRVDILPAGAIVVQAFLRGVGAQRISWSSRGIREGILVDTQERNRHSQDAPELRDWRRQGVEALESAFRTDASHGLQVEHLASELFHVLSVPLALDENDGELLEAAARLHDCGLRVGLEEHHKHSFYLIRHSHLLLGFTSREIEILGLVARYHRKSHPKLSHPEWARLPEEDRRRVKSLAGILRVADGLDRRHAKAVSGLRIVFERDALLIEVAAEKGQDISMEVWGADSKRQLLEECLGRPVLIRARE